MNDLQRDFYRRLRAPWGQRWFYTAEKAYELARNAELFSVSRADFYRRVKLG